MYICTPVIIHTHTYILVTWASCSPEGQRAKKQSFWVCAWGPSQTSQTLLRETLAIQLSKHILQDHPSQSCGPRGTLISAVGQGNPTLQPGHGAPGTASMPPWHPLLLWERAPCSCIPQRSTRGGFDVCFLVTSATWSLIITGCTLPCVC